MVTPLTQSTYTRVEKTNPFLNGEGLYEDDVYLVWYNEGVPHNTNGPAVINKETGAQMWYKEGIPHRVNGPAFILLDGTEEWYEEGELHRLDGPALTHIASSSDGDVVEEREEWWVNGEQSFDTFECALAVSHTTSYEQFVHLMNSEDPVVRALATANPHCPTEVLLYWELKWGNS